MGKIDTLVKIVLRAAIRWSWLLITCLIAGVVFGSILTTALPPVYQATAIVQLNAHTRTSQTQIVQPVASYSRLVISDPVLSPILKKYPQLDRQVFITKELVVTSDLQSQSFQIQVTLPNANSAADIANELAQSLVTQQNAYIKMQYEKAIQLVEQRIVDSQKAIDRLNQQYATTPASNTATLTQLASQIDQQRSLQNTTIANQQALITEQALYSAPLLVVASAIPPARASSALGTIPYVPVMICLFFMIGIMVAGFLEQSSGRINGAPMLQQKSSIPVLGALCWTRPMLLQMLCRVRTPYTEDCRVMMADVLFHAEQAGARIITVTSLRSGSGTSSVAAILAALLAQSDRRILLVDANLYNPSIHEQVKIPNESGLAMMLEEARRIKASIAIGGASPVDIIERLPVENFISSTGIPNLFVLPAGSSAYNPADLLSMPEMSQLLEWAARPVDFMIIDCPSLDHGDAHVLSALSDQTLVVVDATRDRVAQVLNMKQSLAGTGVKLAGLVVSKLGHWR